MNDTNMKAISYGSSLTVQKNVDINDIEADLKWQEAFANTTEEEFDWVEKMFTEEEEKNGIIPLDFTGK